jgi:hypothetical protein
MVKSGIINFFKWFIKYRSKVIPVIPGIVT